MCATHVLNLPTYAPDNGFCSVALEYLREGLSAEDMVATYWIFPKLCALARIAGNTEIGALIRAIQFDPLAATILG